MQPYLPQNFFLLVLTCLAFVHIPKSFCQDQQYVTCGEPFQCGNLTFSYPFWGGNRPSSCGYPGFELTCESSVAFLTFIPLRYRVLVIDRSQRSLTVARDDLWSSICPRFLSNDTFNSKIISYSSGYQNVTLSYGCTILMPNFPQQPNQFDCTFNNTTSFYSTNIIAINTTDVECSSSISVPVNQAAIQNLRTSAALQTAVNGGFGIQWEANNSVCEGCTRSGGRCGYKSNTNSFACYCSDRPHKLTCNHIQDPCSDQSYELCASIQNGYRPSGRPYPMVSVARAFGLSFGAIGILLSVAAAYYFLKGRSSCEGMMWWKQGKGSNQTIEAFIRNYGCLVPKYYAFSQIRTMTDSFAHKLGQGGYGSVYKGELCDGHQVAVKVLRNNKGDGEEFINEVASISRTSHVNVVTLLGFCYEVNRRALIYDFMPNGSLDKFIGKKDSHDADCRLKWKVLYQIALGTARGLEYLHQGCNTRIVHFDIKPHNILLDKDFCPKISDFGLAKLCKKKESILSTIGARGTAGYIAPEVFFRGLGGISHKSDVYSYGMMVLEMVGSKSKMQVITEKNSEKYFPEWIFECLQLEKDPGLEGVMNAEEEEAAMKLILVGLRCIQTKPSDRPSMGKVVEMLEGSIQSLQIPPRPLFVDSPSAIRSLQELVGASSL